ncbi:MAG TPA: serine hydrolase domain-containing protein, partial [Bryobacteraceae bacterium]|nr:serine hydrolase domain-containing protein [Bryobacteraceae bacterium]
MSTISRREFSQLAIALGVSTRALRAGTSIDDTLRTGIQRRNIPCVTAAVATADKITYQGAFGTRDAASGVKVTPDSIFAIASMTKAITSAAAMQLVEQGKITLDEPASKFLPDLAKLEVIDGFDATTGKPKTHTVRTPITLKHLLTHTSGLAYPQWSDVMMQYTKATGKSFRPTTVAPMAPLIFEPGTRWHYGFSADWTGKL